MRPGTSPPTLLRFLSGLFELVPRTRLDQGPDGSKNTSGSQARSTIVFMTLFAASCIIPFLLICGLATSRWVVSEQQRSLDFLASIATNASDDVERFLDDRTTILNALATSPALDHADYGRFDAQARELLERDGIGVVLRDRDGIVPVNTLVQSGTELLDAARESAQVVRETARANVSGLIDQGGSRSPAVVISVPVSRGGSVRYVLSAFVHPVVFTNLLKSSGVSNGYFGCVVDRNGRVVGRSIGNKLEIGQVMPGFTERTEEKGIWQGQNTQGEPIRVQYARLAESGWLVNVGITESALAAPLRSSIWSMAGLALALILGAFVLTLPILRKMLEAQRIAAQAQLSLTEQEQRHRSLIEALPQMVCSLSPSDGALIYANRKFYEFHGRGIANFDAAIASYHPSDAPRIIQKWTDVRVSGSAGEIEARLSCPGGAYRWHRLMAVPIDAIGANREWICTSLDIHDIVASRAHLEETAGLLHLAQDAAGAAAWDWDMRSGVLTLAPASARMHGLPVPDETGRTASRITFDQWQTCIVPEDVPAVWNNLGEAIAARSTFVTEFRIADPHAANGHRWIQSLGRVIVDEQTGEPVRMVGLHLDVSDRRAVDERLRASEARLRISEERLGLALDSSEDGLWDWDLATGETWGSERWHTMLGFGPGKAAGNLRTWTGIIHPDDRDHVAVATRDHLKGLTPALRCEYRLRRADGHYVWVLTRGRVVGRDGHGRALRMVGTHIDITQRKEAEIRIAHMARHDALTDLPNRVVFRECLEGAIRRTAVDRGSFAVLSCDLDRFKAVNDTLGHPAGDRLLCVVAERIKAVLRTGDVVARLGGDEFAVVLSGIDDESDACRIAQRIIDAVGDPILIDHIAVDVGISIGVALVPDDGTPPDEIFKRADTALFQAKAAGRNTYGVFDIEAHARTATRSLLALDMKDAIRRGDFYLVYQPVIDVTTHAIASFEALMRWRHPIHGVISPAEFIPLAEETSLIVPLGAWALKEACREALNWPSSIRVAVNVSAVQFRGGLEEAVLTALTSAGLDACRLKLEVTESVLMHNPEAAIATLHRLRALGVKIALDDFGTGYSSLSYLRRFPFDKIKIDRAFIRDIADPDAAAIVRAVVGIGERLNMGIVAEGVETAEQLEMVRREGCNEVQGFLFSKPLPAAEALAFVAAHVERVAA